MNEDVWKEALEQDTEDGAATQEEEGTTKEELYLCDEGGHAGGGIVARFRGHEGTKTDDLLCRPLTKVAERKGPERCRGVRRRLAVWRERESVIPETSNIGLTHTASHHNDVCLCSYLIVLT